MVTQFQAVEAEKKAMNEGVRENGIEEADKVVHAVLAARHSQEMRDVDKTYAAEKKVMVDDALSQLAAKYDKERDEVTKRQERELSDLQVSVM